MNRCTSEVQILSEWDISLNINTQEVLKQEIDLRRF